MVHPITIFGRLRGVQYDKHCSVVNKKLTFASIEDADSSLPAIKYFVPTQSWVTVSLDPDSRHCIVKDLVLLEYS